MTILMDPVWYGRDLFLCAWKQRPARRECMFADRDAFPAKPRFFRSQFGLRASSSSVGIAAMLFFKKKFTRDNRLHSSRARRVGQQGSLTRIWAKRGSRPRAPRDQRCSATTKRHPKSGTLLVSLIDDDLLLRARLRFRIYSPSRGSPSVKFAGDGGRSPRCSISVHRCVSGQKPASPSS
jgi:hypothetical protein